MNLLRGLVGRSKAELDELTRLFWDRDVTYSLDRGVVHAETLMYVCVDRDSWQVPYVVRLNPISEEVVRSHFHPKFWDTFPERLRHAGYNRIESRRLRTNLWLRTKEHVLGDGELVARGVSFYNWKVYRAETEEFDLDDSLLPGEVEVLRDYRFGRRN